MVDADTGFDVAACLARVRQNDEDAARALFRHLYPLVARRVRSHQPRRMGEDDLCQMVMIKIFNNLDQYAGVVPLDHWVSRIAVNTCLKQLRAEKIRPELRWSDLGDEERQVLDAITAAPESLDANGKAISKDLVEHLLAHLEPASRLVITLLHLEGRSVEEIKALTGWSGALVKVRAFRARQKLRALFAKLVQKEAAL